MANSFLSGSGAGKASTFLDVYEPALAKYRMLKWPAGGFGVMASDQVLSIALAVLALGSDTGGVEDLKDKREEKRLLVRDLGDFENHHIGLR